LHSSIVQTRKFEQTPQGRREAIKFATIDSSAALMLARQNVTRHSQLNAAMQSLTQTGVNVIGSVLNEY